MSESRSQSDAQTRTNGSRLPSRNRTPPLEIELLDSLNEHPRDPAHEALTACLAEMRGKMVAWSRDFDTLLKELVENPEDAMIGHLVIPQSKSSLRLQTLERYLPTFLKGLAAFHLDGPKMHEYVRLTFARNESVTLCVVEPLDCPGNCI